MKRLQLLLGGIIFPVISWAQTVPPVLMPTNGDKNLLPGEGSQDGKAIDFVKDELAPALTSGYLLIVLAVAVLMVMIAGAMYIFSNGNEELVGKAKTVVIWTMVAVVVAILSYTLVAFITNIQFTV